MPKKKIANPKMTGVIRVEIEILGSEIYPSSRYLVVPLSADLPMARVMNKDLSRMTTESRDQLKALSFKAAEAWANTHGYKIDPTDCFYLSGKYSFRILEWPPEED